VLNTCVSRSLGLFLEFLQKQDFFSIVRSAVAVGWIFWPEYVRSRRIFEGFVLANEIRVCIT